MGRRGRQGGRPGVGISDPIEYAISRGVGRIVNANPRFKGYEGYIVSLLDPARVENLFYSFLENHKRDTDPQSGAISDLIKYISDIGSGDYSSLAFKDKELANKILLDKGKGLEGKVGFWEKFRNRGRIHKPDEIAKYFDERAHKIDQMAPYIGENAPAEMASVSEAVGVFNLERYRNLVADQARAVGLIDERGYRTAKRGIYERAQQSYHTFEKGIRNFLTGQQVAASILGLGGLGILFFSGRQLTGNVVGTPGLSTSVGFFVGLGLVFASFLFFAKISRDKKKARYMGR